MNENKGTAALELAAVVEKHLQKLWLKPHASYGS